MNFTPVKTSKVNADKIIAAYHTLTSKSPKHRVKYIAQRMHEAIQRGNVDLIAYQYYLLNQSTAPAFWNGEL